MISISAKNISEAITGDMPFYILNISASVWIVFDKNLSFSGTFLSDFIPVL